MNYLHADLQRGGMYGVTMLHNYGIQNEISDLRVHVSVCNATAYTFLPSAAMDAIKAHPNLKLKPAYQVGINYATAEGYAMPVKFIDGIKSIKIPEHIFMDANFLQSDNTTVKGNKAVFCVKEMLKRNLIPFAFNIEEVTDRTMQIQGTDILVSARYKIQIKCDWRIGETGNIYLQTAECNPLKRI